MSSGRDEGRRSNAVLISMAVYALVLVVVMCTGMGKYVFGLL